MKHLLWVALALVVGLGCEKKSSTGATAGGDGGSAVSSAEPAKPKYSDTSALWALAPADATLGFVIGDGAGTRVLATWTGMMSRLQGKPFAKKTIAQMEELKKQAGFDIFSPQGYQSKGIDISKGFAVFTTADVDKPALVILPVGDRVAFRKLAEATVEKVGDREIDKLDKIVCVEANGRYACSSTVEQIDAAMKPHDSPLAATVKGLAPENRGDAELYIDASKMPKIKEELAEVRQFGDIDNIGAALRVDAAASNLVGWANGTMSPLVSMIASTPPPTDLAGLTANATSVFRVKFDPKLIAASGAPATLPVPNGQPISLVDLLTGDIQIVTAGKGILAGALLVKVTDPAKVKPLIAAVCAEVQKDGSLPVSGVVAKEDSCSGAVSLAALKEALGVDLPPFKFNLAVNGNLFAVVLGDLDLDSLKGSVVDDAGSAEAKAILGGPQTAVLWSRNFGLDLSSLPKEIVEKINAVPDMADGFNMMNWSASHVYDVAAGFSVTPKGVKLLVHATTFEADPADAKNALEAAFDLRANGDRAGYLAALADIEKKFPASLAARRAKLERVGTPIVGPIIGAAFGVGAGVAYFVQRMGSLATPTTGGGFGSPGTAPANPSPPPANPTPDGK
jgi:hypothetical protein